ncbi:hypothetical protein JTB14_000422 [Gonioctena quinquepunctata]|nr:hypothetical protein JTB14_000422 [Gonioctena quinquepunctata]
MNRKTLESLQCSVGKHKKSSEAEKSNIISQYESSGESPEIRELSDNVVESPTEFECSSNEDDQLADTSLTKSSDTIEEVGPKIEIQESTLTVPKVEEEPEDLANVHQMPESHIKKEPNIDISEKVGEQESVEVQVKEEPEVDQIKKESDDVKDTLSVIQNTKPSRGEFEEFSRHAQDIRNELHELFGDPQEQTTPGPSEKPNFFCDTHWSSEDIQRLTKSIDKD